MFYSELSPSTLLLAYVRKYWFLEGFSGTEASTVERILPDGCTELIIHYGQPFRKIDGNNQNQQETAFVFGQLDRFIDLLPGQNIGVMGVRFHPWGLNQFIKIPAANLKGEAVSLKDLFGNAEQELVDKILESTNVKQKAEIMDRFLMNHFKNKTSYPGISSIIDLIKHHEGSLSIDRLTRMTGHSERQLERYFYNEIGLSPKSFSRILRFQNVLRLATKARSLTDLALSAGYYDQAHFSREFTEIAGNSPRNYFKGEKGINGLFFEA